MRILCIKAGIVINRIVADTIEELPTSEGFQYVEEPKDENGLPIYFEFGQPYIV